MLTHTPKDKMIFLLEDASSSDNLSWFFLNERLPIFGFIITRVQIENYLILDIINTFSENYQIHADYILIWIYLLKFKKKTTKKQEKKTTIITFYNQIVDLCSFIFQHVAYIFTFERFPTQTFKQPLVHLFLVSN